MESPTGDPFKVRAHCSMKKRDAWIHINDGQWLYQHCLLLLWFSVAMGIADISFHPSLLDSRTVDVEAVRRYYDPWSPKNQIRSDATINRAVWLPRIPGPGPVENASFDRGPDETDTAMPHAMRYYLRAPPAVLRKKIAVFHC
jgi:hypothetical protein